MDKIKFWEDAPGHQSSGRLVFLVITLWNIIYCTLITFVLGVQPTIVMAIFSGIEAIAGGQKLIQNSQENTLKDKENLLKFKNSQENFQIKQDIK